MENKATLYKRGDYWWINYRDDRGIRHRIPTHTTSYKDARVILQGVQEGVFPEGELKLTVDELLESLEGDMWVRGLKDLDKAKSKMKNIHRILGDRNANSISLKDIREYVERRRRDEVSNATINRELALLRQAYNLAVKDGVKVKPPHIPMLKESAPRQGHINSCQLEELISYLPGYLKNFTRLGYITGARKSELAGLKWKDIGGDYLVFNDTKNGESRSIPLVQSIKDILDLQRLIKQGDYVFHLEGVPVGDFRKSWYRACEEAGLKGLLFHDLRRSTAVNLARQGIDASTIMKIMGHKTRVMLDRYRIVSDVDMRRALGDS